MERLLMAALVAVLLLGSAPVPARDDFAARLAQADALRSADPERSSALLADLAAEAAQGTPAQRRHIEYLQAYRLAVYGNRPDEAARRAMVLFEQAEDVDLRFRAGALAASAMAISRDFDASLRVLNQVLPLRGDVRDDEIRLDGVYAAALLYSEMGQYRLSLRYADEILAQDPSPRTRCFAALPQLEARLRLDQMPIDDGPLGRSIDLCLSLGEDMTASFLRLVLARKLVASGRSEDALELLRMHLPQIDAIGYQRLSVDAHALVAELLLERGDLDGAADHAARAVSSARSFSSGMPLVTAHRVLFEAAEARDDVRAALDHYRRYVEADRAHVGDLRARELAYAIVRDETTAQARRIELLGQQNQILELQQQVAQQAARTTRILVLVLVVLVAGAGWWAWRMARRQSKAAGR